MVEEDAKGSVTLDCSTVASVSSACSTVWAAVRNAVYGGVSQDSTQLDGPAKKWVPDSYKALIAATPSNTKRRSLPL